MYLIRHHLLRLRTLRGKTIVHVGAHRGQEAALYAKWGAARVIWVEADPETAHGLRQHLSEMDAAPQDLMARTLGFPRTAHQVIEALIGDEDGKLTDFHVFSNDGESSSIFRKAPEANSRHATIVETGTVRQLAMRSLDRLLPENGIPLNSVDILVLDVQGAELLCLKVALGLLSCISLLETEVATTAWYDGGVLLPELDTWLAQCGFLRRTRVRRSMMNAIYTR